MVAFDHYAMAMQAKNARAAFEGTEHDDDTAVLFDMSDSFDAAATEIQIRDLMRAQMRSVSSPFGEQFTLPSADNGEVATKNICCWRIQAASLSSICSNSRTMTRLSLTSSRQHPVAHKGIALPFLPKGRGRPMAGYKSHLVAEWPEPVSDRVDERGVIAARKVGSADGAGEQHVADEADLR